MRTVLSLLVASVLATLAQAEPYFFKPSGWAIGTYFPAEPKQSEKRTQKPDGTIVESYAVFQMSSGALTLGRFHYPSPFPQSRIPTAYDSAQKSTLSTMGATLISEKQIEILGYEGRRFVCSAKNGDFLCEIRLLIINDELFTFMHLHPTESLNTTEAAAFFEKISGTSKE